MGEIYRFDTFELDATSYQLRHAGEAVRLERIPLDLLFLLVRRRGELVSRQEILDQVWGKDIALDADNAINTAIRKIRRAVKDNSEQPRFLHTVPGKGYRFEAALAGPEPAPVLVESPDAGQPGGPSGRGRRRTLIVAAAIIACLGTALVLFRPKPAASKIMLAVLPFTNFSGDPAQEYLADGMTEEMITALGGLDPAQLGVIARTSAMQYKNAHKSGTQIAKELSVQYLLEGSIRRSNGRLRVTAQLIQARDQTHLWAEDFDRDQSDILDVQGEVARAIASQIRLAISTQSETHLVRARVSSEAHEAYLQGLYGWNQRSAEGSALAIRSFQRAIALEPNYAEAYSALARVYAFGGLFLHFNARESSTRTLQFATRALELDNSVADAHTTLGFIISHDDFDWDAARREFQRGLELAPGDPNSHLFYSNSYLTPLGRHDEAIAEMKKAVELDPLSLPIQSFFGRTYGYAKQYGAALAQLNKAITMDPNFALNHIRLARIYEYTGNLDQAIAETSRARILTGEDPKSVLAKETMLRQALTTRGPRGYWDTLIQLAASPPNPPEAHVGWAELAIVYSNLGQPGKALDLLEEAQAHGLGRVELAADPGYEPLHSNPRYAALLRATHLAR
jgi:TolB-like protein/DNA-binding winged helix-turn-helix (wHTH) protein